MRKLTLTKETVAELTAGELTNVVGAAAATGKYCLTEDGTICNYSELDTCLTHPCTR